MVDITRIVYWWASTDEHLKWQVTITIDSPNHWQSCEQSLRCKPLLTMSQSMPHTREVANGSCQVIDHMWSILQLQTVENPRCQLSTPGPFTHLLDSQGHFVNIVARTPSVITPPTIINHGLLAELRRLSAGAPTHRQHSKWGLSKLRAPNKEGPTWKHVGNQPTIHLERFWIKSNGTQ